MAADAAAEASSDDILQGSEPGASRNSMLLATNSYDDLTTYLSDSNLSSDRHSSGSISEIAEDHPSKSGASDLKSDHANAIGTEIAENEINERLESTHLGRDGRISPNEVFSDNEGLVTPSDSDTLADRVDDDTPTSQLSEVRG